MRLIISLLFFFTFTMIVNAQKLDILQVRYVYYKAVESETATQNLKALLNNSKNDNCLTIGYEAATYMLLSKHSLDPITKYKWFLKGRDLLEDIILKNTKSIELRFLRYSIQLQLPSFLKYNLDIENDRHFIQSNLESLDDTDLKIRILSFLKNY